MFNNTVLKSRGLLIAGVGVVTALFALLFLPFATVMVDLNSSGVEHPQGNLDTVRVDLYLAQVAQEYTMLWLCLPLTLALTALVLGLVVKRGSSRTTSIAGRGWVYTLVGGALLNVLLLVGVQWLAKREIQVTYLHFPAVEEAINASFRSLLSDALTALLGGQALLRHLALLTQASLEMAPGFYLALSGMAAAIAGGWLALMDDGMGGTGTPASSGVLRRQPEAAMSSTRRPTDATRVDQYGEAPLREYVSRKGFLPIEYPQKEML